MTSYHNNLAVAGVLLLAALWVFVGYHIVAFANYLYKKYKRPKE